MRANRNRMRPALALAGLLALSAAAGAKDLETTHLFGFTLGSDVNDAGEIEGESETTGRFVKRAGSYSAIASELGLKFILFENFSVEPVLGVAYHAMSGIPGLADRQQGAFDTLALELRYRLLDRAHAPIGLTLGVDPHWGRVDETSGEPVDRYGADLLMIIDREILADRLFGAFNLVYQPEGSRSRAAGDWQHQSDLAVSAALSAQVRSGVLIGAEARYMRSYDGLALDTLTGHAVFVGPTFYAKFNERLWMSAAWSIQVMGRAANDAGSLDLTNFERHQAVLRFGYNF
jgi:hypothetical protein